MISMKKRPRELHECLVKNASLAGRLSIPNINPIGAGTRGVVYATVYPDVIVKLSQDDREVAAASRLKKLAHPNIVKVHASFAVDVGGKQIVFTYLEKLRPLSALQQSSHEYFQSKFKFSYHRPRTMLAALNRAIDLVEAPVEYRPYLRTYRSLLTSLLDAREWHRDLKAPNLMMDKRGNLCVTDIGSFTDRQLVVVRDPVILYEELEPIAADIRTSGWPGIAKKLLRVANEVKIPKIVAPIDSDLPDPHGDDSELDDNIFDHFIPNEMVNDPSPAGPKWRNPARHQDVRRQPRLTVDVGVQRGKMNGDHANRSK